MKKSETKKYIAVIDPKAESGFRYKMLNAKNLLDAMSEAKALKTYDVYLVNIFKKIPGGD